MNLIMLLDRIRQVPYRLGKEERRNVERGQRRSGKDRGQIAWLRIPKEALTVFINQVLYIRNVTVVDDSISSNTTHLILEHLYISQGGSGQKPMHANCLRLENGVACSSFHDECSIIEEISTWNYHDSSGTYAWKSHSVGLDMRAWVASIGLAA